MFGKKKKVLTKDEIAMVEQAIKAAELKSAGEIVVRIVMDSKQFQKEDVDADQAVHLRALDEFEKCGIVQTEGATGVMLFLSVAEKRVEVLADKAINEKVEHVVWEDIVATIVEGFKANAPGKGIAKGVDQAGILLSKHFPRADDDVNELTDEVKITD